MGSHSEIRFIIFTAFSLPKQN